MFKVKKVLSVMLTSLLIFSMTVSSYASYNDNKVISNSNNAITVSENGEKLKIVTYETDDYNTSIIYDEAGNEKGRYVFDKINCTVFSSFTGKTIVIDSPYAFTTYSKIGQCKPGDTENFSGTTTYADMLEVLGKYASYAAKVAFVCSLFGIGVSEVVGVVIDAIGEFLNDADTYSSSYLNSHGLKFKCKGTCKYNHRAQLYVMMYKVYDYETF